MGAGIENRITYDPDEITRLLENQLDKLNVQAYCYEGYIAAVTAVFWERAS